MADRSVSVSLDAQVAGFVNGMRTAHRSVGAFMTELDKSAKKRRALDDLGATAGKVGLVAAAGLGMAVKAAIDWESAWAGVEKTVDGTAAQMAQLEAGLRGLAQELPASHREIAAVAEAAGQLGVAREDIVSFTRTMVALGETTNLSADEAATSIAQMANVMGTAPDEIDNVGSALVALGNAGASTEREILGMAQRIAASGAQIGLAESDILAIANAAVSMGVEVEAGGTAVSRVFTDMAKATAQGGEDLEAFAQVAGMSAQEFAAAFQEDPAQAFASFTQGLDQINKSGGDVFTTLENLGLADVRVSQALLGMAASGDLLTESLALGNQAWNENTALAMEAAKRYDTTASQMQVAWNNIQDAAIEFGSVALPVLAAAAGKVSDFAQAVGDLPQPVKTATAGLLGLTALLGGGAWAGAKVIGTVNDMRSALTDMGLSAQRTGKLMQGMKIAAAIAGAAIAVDALQSKAAEALPNMEALTGQLIDMSRSGAGAKMATEFDSLGKSIERLTDKRIGQKLQDTLNDWGAPGKDSKLEEAEAEVAALDAALTNLVNNGAADTAASALESMAEAQGLSADEVERLMSVLPGYQEALDGVANEAKLAADGSGAAADGITAIGDAADSAAAEADSFKDSLQGLNDFFEGRSSARDYQAALDDMADSIKENGRSFDIATAKGRTNQAALDDIASSALELAGTMQGAARQKFLTAAIRDLETMGPKFGVPKAQTDLLIGKLREAQNTDVNPKITVNVGPALSAIDQVASKLLGIDGRQVNTYIRTHHVSVTNPATGATKGRGVTANADGGFYPRGMWSFAGGGFLPGQAMIAPPAGAAGMVQWAERETGGEAFIPLAPSKRPRSVDILSDVADQFGYRLETYATGGIRGAGSAERNHEARQKRLEAQIDKVKASLDKNSDRLKDLADTRLDLQRATMGNFRNDPFADAYSVAGAVRSLNADTKAARAHHAAKDRALALGLDGQVYHDLLASGNTRLLADVDTRTEVRQLEAAWSARNKSLRGFTLGAFPNGPGADTERELAVAVKDLRGELKRLEAAVERGARAGTTATRKATSKARTKTASKVRR